MTEEERKRVNAKNWKKYYQKNADKERARQRAYYHTHREEILAKRKADREAWNLRAAEQRRQMRERLGI